MWPSGARPLTIREAYSREYIDKEHTFDCNKCKHKMRCILADPEVLAEQVTWVGLQAMINNKNYVGTDDVDILTFSAIEEQ